MVAEFEVWEKALPWQNANGDVAFRSTGPVRVFPHMSEEGGLPEGWEACWLSDHPSEARYPYTACVVRRTAGGWGLLFSREGTTKMWVHGFRTVGNLYETARTAGPDNTALAGMVHPISAFIVSHYDLTDEAEAAEATVVGLGGLVTVLPRPLAPLP
jgi:hypothetical protein